MIIIKPFARSAFALLLVGCLLLLACTKANNTAQPIVKEEVYAFGTLVNITLYGLPEEKAYQIIGAVVNDFSYLENVWHPWKAGSLGRVNQLLPTKAAFSTGPNIIKLIIEARKLSHTSDNYFNPAIGGLVKLWGFHQDEMPIGPPPSQVDIDNILKQKPSLDNLDIKGFTITSNNEAVILDFGGFAKGYAVQQVIDHIKELGATNAIINVGGDLHVIGNKAGEPWRIGIRNPRGEGILASIAVEGSESVFTSGDYERFYEYQGKRYHHILDPNTGFPVQGVSSVTVVHSSPATADAAATALFVAGPTHWQRIAKQMGLHQVMLIDDQGVVYMTPEMQQRIRFEIEPRPEIIVQQL